MSKTSDYFYNKPIKTKLIKKSGKTSFLSEGINLSNA